MPGEASSGRTKGRRASSKLPGQSAAGDDAGLASVARKLFFGSEHGPPSQAASDEAPAQTQAEAAPESGSSRKKRKGTDSASSAAPQDCGLHGTEEQAPQSEHAGDKKRRRKDKFGAAKLAAADAVTEPISGAPLEAPRSEPAVDKKRRRKDELESANLAIADAAVTEASLAASRESAPQSVVAAESAAAESGEKKKRRRKDKSEAAKLATADAVTEGSSGLPQDSAAPQNSAAAPSEHASEKKRRRKDNSGAAEVATPGAVTATHGQAAPQTPSALKRANNGILKQSKGTTPKKVRFQEDPVETQADETLQQPISAGEAQECVDRQDKDANSDSDSPDASGHFREGWFKDNKRRDVRYGRFSPEEDNILKQAVLDYFKESGLSEEDGLRKLLSGKTVKECAGCWVEIGKSLPRRSLKAIHSRAHRLLHETNHLGKWSAEEEETLVRLHDELGPKWKKIADRLGRYAYAAKDKWRDLKIRGTRRTGPFLQSELETVASLVHNCIRAKAQMSQDGEKFDRRIIREDINWDSIADALGTRTHATLCKAWYVTLRSSMVAEGLWANVDDCLLLKRLLESGACADDAVDWDSLLGHREGHICKRRWEQMAKHLGPDRLRPFEEKLHLLLKRYAPDVLESVQGPAEAP